MLTRQHAIGEHDDREGAFARDRIPAIVSTRLRAIAGIVAKSGAGASENLSSKKIVPSGGDDLSATHPRAIGAPLAVLHGIGRRLIASLRRAREVLLIRGILLRLALGRTLVLRLRRAPLLTLFVCHEE